MLNGSVEHVVLGGQPDRRRDLIIAFFHYMERINGYRCLRQLDAERYAAIYPFAFTTALITGRLLNFDTYDDRWCYHDAETAKAALDAWDGTGEPEGCHRQPASGRRMAETTGEMDNDGNMVPPGRIYQRW